MKKRIISFFMILCMAVSIVPSFTLPVSAKLTAKDDWASGSAKKTVNLIPAMKEGDPLIAVGWGNVDREINDTAWETDNKKFNNKIVIRAFDEEDDIGKKDFTGGVYWQIEFSDEDKVKINKGDLSLSSSARYWFQRASHHYISLRFEFFDAQDNLIDKSHKKTFDKHYTLQENPTLSLDKVEIPANTAYVRIWFSNWGSLSGRPFIGDMEAYLTDIAGPKPTEDVHEYSVNGSTTFPEYVVPGDVVTYAVRFNEAVTVSSTPRIVLSNGITKSFSQVEYSADRQTVYFPVELTNTRKNADLRLTEIEFNVLDDAGNLCAYIKTINISVGTLQYRALFNVTKNLTNLSSTGASTVKFGYNYTAKLTPDAGYKLPDSITVKVNGAATSDYTYKSSTGDIKVNYSAIRGDIEISASAPPQTYTVTFDMQGGKGGTKSAQATYTQTMPDVTPPTRDGYTFGGYFDRKNGTGARYYDINGRAYGKYDKTADATLYAKWTPKNYTVTLDATGGTNGGTVTAEYDADMPSISKPVKKGYTFLGYFTGQNGTGTMYYNANSVSARKYDKTDGLMLYAAWKANTYKVTFDMQGGTGTSSSTNATYDSKMPTVTPPVRDGYTFEGYFIQPSGAGTQYYYATGEGAKIYDIDADTTLYAKWSANTYDVVLNAQGGSGGSTVSAAFDSNMPPIAAPDKPGYIFGGYFDGKNGTGTKYYNADCSSARVYDKTEGTTLYALWTPITYNIQLYSRGENAGTLKNVVYGELRLPSDEDIGISYPNYNFVGWNIYDEQNWAMYTSGRTYSAGLVTEQGKTAYVYAAWLEKDKYTVTYDANGGEGAPSAVEVHADETINLSSIVPTRQNYTFAGWSEKSDSTSAAYQPNDSFTMGNSLVTLFAIWNKNPELTYNANGGTFGAYALASYPPAGSFATLTGTVPKKEGYTFVGWAESETSTRADIVSSPYTMPNHDTVLYAVYEPIKYTVSVSTAGGYSVSGINSAGYMIGEYVEFTVSGASPKVYINGMPAQQSADGKYKFEIKDNSSVVVSDSSLANVIYNANGGINAPIDMLAYTNGDTAYVKSNQPSRTGYTFGGWALDKDSGYVQYTGGEGITVISDDVILYAVWEPISYTIKYDANSGSGNMGTTTVVYDETGALSKNVFTKTGCQFAGWSYAPNGEIAYTDGANIKNLTETNNEEITLYAVWKGAKTKINFRFEGGSMGTVSCEAVYGKLILSDRLIAPQRHGYTFAGYYTMANKGGNLVYNADMTPSEYYKTNPWDSALDEFDLYAAWEPISYTVAFADGTKTLDTMSAVYGNTFSLPKAETLGISVPNGYTFGGWSVAPGSDTVYYHDGQEISSGLASENGAVVYLYAVILKNVNYKVTLPASGEGYKVYYNNTEVTSKKDIDVNKGDNVSFKICVEDGYSSDKMTVSANGVMLGATKIDGNNYFYSINCVSSDTGVNIYHVKKETFRIILSDGTGYSVSPKNTVVESGDDFSFTVTLSQEYKTAVPTVFVNGNTLSGSKNGNAYTYTVSNVTSQPVISISVAAKRQYTVTFASNGSIYSISTVEENMKASQPISPERNGYVFGGWYKDANCTHPYDFQSEITSDVKLYAKWTANTYAVEYNKNTTDNISVPSWQTKNHDNVLVLSSQIPSRTGYTFVQWNTKADGTGTSYSAGSELNVNADITLYAQWKINKYSVTLITGEGVTGSLGANEVEYGKTVTVSAVSGKGFGDPTVTAIPQENAELVSAGLYKITGPVSFVASATAKKVNTANFYFDGGLYYTQSAIEESAVNIALPTPPSKPGYSFVGWYTEQTGGTEVNETTMLDKNMSVYARFKANTLNITPAQSGEGYTVDSTDNTSVTYGGNYTFTVTIADHYNADNMKVYANGMLLTGTENNGAYTYTVKNIVADQKITVTGVSIDKHTVTYMVNGQVYSTVQADYNSLLAEPTSPEKAGETFKGWSDTNRIWNFATDRVISDITLYAVWEGEAFTVTPAQSGEGYTVDSTDNTNVTYGGNYTFTVTIADHYNANNMKVYANGMLLTGTENNGAYTYIVKNIVADQKITVTGVSIDKHTVTYMVNGQVYSTVQADYNSLLAEPTSPEKAGETFKGWSDTNRIWNFATDKVISDITLYAVWEGEAFTVTPAQNGEGYTVNSTDNTSVTYGGNYTFTITIADHYNADNMKVYANGILLIGTKSGNAYTFKVDNILINQVITVTGVELDKHTVTYMVNGQVYSTVQADYNSLLAEPTSPEKAGETFKGWSDTNRIWNFATDKVTSDITLYAVWEGETFTVTPAQNGEGYTVDSTDNTNVTYGGNYTFTVTIADHYNADNMKVYANGIFLIGTKSGNAYTFKVENILINQVITVTGVSIDKHTVTYMVNGQVYSTVQADYNSLLAEPTSPEKAGETFKGWSDTNRIWDFATDKVISDITLYAVWEGETFTVTPAQNGEGYTVDSTDNTSVTYGGNYTFTVTIADHYNANDMKVYANGMLLTGSVNGKTYTYTVKNITDDITIIVSDVTPDIYTVKYIVDGETYYSENVDYTGKAQKPKSPSKTGYTFVGWFDGNDEWDFAAEIEDDLELEAKFKALTYQITVPDNKSEFTVDVTTDTTAEYGGSFAFNITVSEGYNASDMAVYANGVLLEKVSENGDTVYFEINNVTESKAITVRGIGQNTYSVTYKANTSDYVGNMPENTIKSHNTDVTVSDLIPERYGYTFVGWAASKDGNAAYFGKDTYSENSDITLYAVWEAKTFAVNFETNGGTINNGEIAEYTYGIGAVLPTDVSKEGYDFAGWYEDEKLSGMRVYEIKENDFGDKKYYAAYTVANVSVTDYTGGYDGKAHDITYTLTDNLSVENYQWYFVPSGSNDAVPVLSDSYNTYHVKNVSESGQYYCYVEALLDGYVIRFFTDKATVSISKKPITVKASDSSKVYDAKPLSTNEAELADQTSLAEGHTMSAVMTAESSITNIGNTANKIDKVTVLDSENLDVTQNYEISKQSGTLSVTPLTLTVGAKDVSVSVNSSLDESSLYQISGMLQKERLSLANITVTAKNANDEDVSFEDITKNIGTYKVTISYTGFEGEGSKNYQGDGTITSLVDVTKKKSGGSSGGGSKTPSTKLTAYTVSFDTDGADKIESQSVKEGNTAKEPTSPEKEGYTFDSWYSDKNLTDKFDFTAKITKDITLYAKWDEIKKADEEPEDLPISDPSKTGVSKLLETERHIKYLNGNGDNTFKPESNMTRAEAAQMFYNLLLNKNASGNSKFNDVSKDAWYCDAVKTLAGMGIINGVGDGMFNPDGEITRAEFVAMTMRFVNIDVNGSKAFSDVSKDHWAAKNISDAAYLGWISGNDDGTFGPDKFITRAAVAKIVNNMLGRKADMKYVSANKDSVKLFSDVSSSAWYYEDVVEASNAHGYEKADGIEIWK